MFTTYLTFHISQRKRQLIAVVESHFAPLRNKLFEEHKKFDDSDIKKPVFVQNWYDQIKEGIWSS
ncbi:hypothetical protein KIN20_022723 [Parelaphostrongylus tenuis]|uniref:Uncharacterized protein n=1 Tax=Parelaphostrongylus tenuis TaxID=148309 RepID=A0AAD5QWZ1_PARTN|nr:hypothetical protein KIN20_022723 [Parelaphostrongylus tenuis]